MAKLIEFLFNATTLTDLGCTITGKSAATGSKVAAFVIGLSMIALILKYFFSASLEKA